MELKKMYIFITIFIFVNVYSQVYLPNGRVNSSSNGNMGIKTSVLTADFVFEDNYHLPKLEDIEKHIKEKKHLPEIPSASQMEQEGLNIGEFQIKLLQKIEELTLYSIEQNKKIKELEDKIEQLLHKKR